MCSCRVESVNTPGRSTGAGCSGQGADFLSSSSLHLIMGQNLFLGCGRTHFEQWIAQSRRQSPGFARWSSHIHHFRNQNAHVCLKLMSSLIKVALSTMPLACFGLLVYFLLRKHAYCVTLQCTYPAIFGPAEFVEACGLNQCGSLNHKGRIAKMSREL